MPWKHQPTAIGFSFDGIKEEGIFYQHSLKTNTPNNQFAQLNELSFKWLSTILLACVAGSIVCEVEV